jgi:glycosyltransferase involved in cell wall biosynthesis
MEEGWNEREGLGGLRMKILHICAGWQKWNGAANIARMIMDEQRREGHEVSFAMWAKVRDLRAADEVWIHCGWLPCLWWAAFWAKNARWMPEACYDPIRLKFSAWKKRLAGPIERWSLRRCKKLVATCDAEKAWIEAYLGKKCPEIVVEDVKRFFDFSRKERIGRVEERGNFISRVERVEGESLAVSGQRLAVRGQELGVSGDGCNSKQETRNWELHVLYLGRRHPLKGVEFLEAAVSELNSSTPPLRTPPLLKIVSNAFGEELEKVWEWCDVLILPTLSENFGLVIAEALERGKRVITTDGAPVWGDGNDYGGRLVYLKGFRDGSEKERIRLLNEAIKQCVG